MDETDENGFPEINLEDFLIDPDALTLVPAEFMREHRLLPVDRAGATLVVAMTDPGDMRTISELEFLIGYKIEVVKTCESDLAKAFNRVLKDT